MTADAVVVRAVALRRVDDAFPGWIEVAVVDARRREHRIVEKAPVLTDRDVTGFPFELWLRARAGRVDGDAVRVSFEHDVETVDGATELTVAPADVVWL